MIKVVLCDDDEDLLDMVNLMLNTPGIKPFCFKDCKQVLPVLEAESPDVLVMDIYLGECDGRSLCKQIKGIDRYASLPVLLYSAGKIPPGTIKESGADLFLEKPFQMQELLNNIQLLAGKE